MWNLNHMTCKQSRSLEITMEENLCSRNSELLPVDNASLLHCCVLISDFYMKRLDTHAQTHSSKRSETFLMDQEETNATDHQTQFGGICKATDPWDTSRMYPQTRRTNRERVCFSMDGYHVHHCLAVAIVLSSCEGHYPPPNRVPGVNTSRRARWLECRLKRRSPAHQ